MVHWVRTVLRTIVMSVLLLLCAALFYVLVIMGDTTKIDTVREPLPATPIGMYQPVDERLIIQKGAISINEYA